MEVRDEGYSPSPNIEIDMDGGYSPSPDSVSISYDHNLLSSFSPSSDPRASFLVSALFAIFPPLTPMVSFLSLSRKIACGPNSLSVVRSGSLIDGRSTPTELLFLKTHFLKMYVPCTNTSHVHMLVAPLQPTYVCMLHHYNPRILAKVAKIKKLQGIR
jgi:hypothetical protein